VALGNWPTMVRDPRVASLSSLIGFLTSSGYEGTEFDVGSFRRYFPEQSDAVVARKTQAELDRAGLANFGATTHVGDQDMRKLGWLDRLRERLKPTQDTGAEFIGFQVNLHPDYLNTGGLYREDTEYLNWLADRVADLRGLCWDMGMNFYLEVHVDRITDDPAATCRLLQLATCELNGDLSHLFFRGILTGRYVQTIQRHVGHTHVRMARQYGDLSAVVEDPKADWAAKGVTWRIFEIMKPALEGGLSSRTITGETGPAFLVKDTLTQDAALVPLYRAMARYADASAQGIAMKVEEPTDLLPWG
jgi:sugar phosphate isomerase/epimerase